MSTDYTLAYGTHATPEDGRCAMEWVSYLAGEQHGDQPQCVSPVLRVFCVALNDGLEHGPRQRLRPYLARTIGTSTDGLDVARAWMAMDWLIRTYTPTWLAASGLTEAAHGLRSLGRVSASSELPRALAALEFAREEASGALGRVTVRWLAPAVAARSTARETAWTTAAAAAWAAARLTIGDMAGDRARATARTAAGDAAATFAREAAATAGSRAAAKEAARAVLAPTVQTLQDSAFGLLNRMLPTVQLAAPAIAESGERRSRAFTDGRPRLQPDEADRDRRGR
jgi:hypothetical protein